MEWIELPNVESDAANEELDKSGKTALIQPYICLEVPVRRTGNIVSYLTRSSLKHLLHGCRHLKRVRKPKPRHLEEGKVVELGEEWELGSALSEEEKSTDTVTHVLVSSKEVFEELLSGRLATSMMVATVSSGAGSKRERPGSEEGWRSAAKRAFQESRRVLEVLAPSRYVDPGVTSVEGVELDWPLLAAPKRTESPSSRLVPLESSELRRIRAGMELALAQARLGRAAGYRPVGCVVVDGAAMDVEGALPGLGRVRGAAFARDYLLEDGTLVGPVHSATFLAVEDVAASDRVRSCFAEALAAGARDIASAASAYAHTFDDTHDLSSTKKAAAPPTDETSHPSLPSKTEPDPSSAPHHHHHHLPTQPSSPSSSPASTTPIPSTHHIGAPWGRVRPPPPKKARTAHYALTHAHVPSYLYSGAARVARDRPGEPPLESRIPGLFLPPPLLSQGLPATPAPPEEDTYLCTGCDVFLTHEPSPMDAMALVHARVGRVFFGVTDDTGGALSRGPEITRIAALNHRYRAWMAAPDSRIAKACQNL